MSTAGTFDRWVFCRAPRPAARLRLLCFPYAGGGISIFHAWPNALPQDIEVWAIQYPGRERRYREPPFERVEALVSELATVLAPRLDQPFACFGNSLGALVAFELARRLRREHGLAPAHFFAAASAAPQLLRADSPIHSLPDDELAREVDRRYQGIPAAVFQDPEFLKLHLPTLRADFSVLETYQYTAEAPLACPVSAFGGDGDRAVPIACIEPWRDQTCGPFRLRTLPGNHFFPQSARAQLLQDVVHDLTNSL